MAEMEYVVEDGLRVVYMTSSDGVRHRYEETAERDDDGLDVFYYTGTGD